MASDSGGRPTWNAPRVLPAHEEPEFAGVVALIVVAAVGEKEGVTGRVAPFFALPFF